MGTVSRWHQASRHTHGIWDDVLVVIGHTSAFSNLSCAVLSLSSSMSMPMNL